MGSAHPELGLNFINRGISGKRGTDLAARWQEVTLSLKPDFLGILIGINDTTQAGERSETAEQFRAMYEKLLATTIAALPHARIVSGEPFLLPVESVRMTTPPSSPKSDFGRQSSSNSERSITFPSSATRTRWIGNADPSPPTTGVGMVSIRRTPATA